MSYEHCDKHDEDATNGCKSCRREQAAKLGALTAFDHLAEATQDFLLDLHAAGHGVEIWMGDVDSNTVSVLITLRPKGSVTVAAHPVKC